MATNVFSPKETTYPISNAHVSSLETYQERYDESIKDPEAFWSTIAERLTWYQQWETVRDYDFVKAQIKWFEGGKLNACYNCLDRHVEAGHGDDTAIIWEGNDPSEDRTFSFNDLLAEVKKFANVLKSQGVEKGDRVCIYLQMV
ncbi:AMP-binding protein, partial [Candidatus Poribacteria bacterium]|nr:AMP-binding protein [Candidatus Poribacteria bacterium]